MYQSDRTVNVCPPTKADHEFRDENIWAQCALHFASEDLPPSAHSPCKAGAEPLKTQLASLRGLIQAGALSVRLEMHAAAGGAIGMSLGCCQAGHPNTDGHGE